MADPTPREHREFSTDDTADETTPIDADRRPTQARPDLRVLYTIAFLALIFIGPRFLDGQVFLVVMVSLFVTRWLYSRWQKGRSAD